MALRGRNQISPRCEMLILSSSLEAFAITMKICKLWVLVSIGFSPIGATPSHCGAATAEPAISVPGAIDNQSAYKLTLAAAQAVTGPLA